MNNSGHPNDPNMLATPFANSVGTLVSFNAFPNITSPPYQMKMSQPARSDFTSSQLNTPVISSATLPSRAVRVISNLWTSDVIHMPQTETNTVASIHSLELIGPIPKSSVEAKAFASGVC